MTLSRATGIACLLASALLTPASATAQNDPYTASSRRPFAPFADTTGWVQADHWTRNAIARLAATNQVPSEYAALAWPARRGAIRRILADAAADTTPGGIPASTGAATAIAWLQRFDREFNEVGPIGLAKVIATPGLDAAEGHLETGHTIPSPRGFDYVGPSLDTTNVTGVFVEIDGNIAFWHGFGFSGRFRAWLVRWQERGTGRHDDLEVDYLTANGRIGALDLWFGRRAVAFGPSPRGGLTLSGSTPLSGGGFDTPTGFRLPGFLSALGTIRVNQVVSRFDRSGDIRHPWFVATRLSFAPSDRLSLGINRAALLGGEGNEPVTLGRVLLVAFGITDSRGKDSDFENQVASLDVAWNAGRSVLVWAEYGFDDAGTSFILVPGVTVGALWASPSWAPALSIGGSVTGIASSCCGHPAWYLHGALSAGWTDDGVPLGHPLGGNGLEAGLDVAVDPIDGPVLARTRLFVRDRGRENLYAPERHGRTVGLEASVQAFWGSYRLEPSFEFEVGAGRDRWEAALVVGFSPGATARE
jgi:hypothetical protein